jgi:serine/threonine-protein kinase RsbW
MTVMSDEVAPDDEIAVERLAPEDAAALPDAIRATYGDSYDHAWAYDTHAVAERLTDGTLVSFVGRAASGDHPELVVGHAGLLRDTTRDPVGESGLAVVDPAWRSHHLFPTLKRALADWCAAEGMFGMYSQVTAAHPYSEKANLRLGAREAGFLLGYIPADVSYTGIDASDGTHRLSVAVFWLATNLVPSRVVHAPLWHAPQLAGLYEHLELPREIVTEPPALAGTTELTTDELEDHDDAIITVRTAGGDLLEAIGAEQHRLATTGRKAIYLDLPLADPATASLPVAVHDDLGFFFGAVVPERRHGDVLRMQSLHDADVNPSDLTTASDYGAELLDYIFERKRTAANHGIVP